MKLRPPIISEKDDEKMARCIQSTMSKPLSVQHTQPESSQPIIKTVLLL
jgi:hypothetical protein